MRIMLFQRCINVEQGHFFDNLALSWSKNKQQQGGVLRTMKDYQGTSLVPVNPNLDIRFLIEVH